MGLFSSKKKSKNDDENMESNDIYNIQADYKGISLDKSLDKNIANLKKIFKDCDDLKFRSFKIAQNINAQMIFIEGMIQVDIVDNYIVKPLMLNTNTANINLSDASAILQYVNENIISTTNAEEINEMEKVMISIMKGSVTLLIDGCDIALSVEVKGNERRSVEQPDAEVTVRGPKDAFTETLVINTSLIRSRIHDPNLKVKTYFIGRRSKTKVVLIYIKDIINPELLKETQNRLEGIDVDYVVGSSFIEQLIEDDWTSPFPQLKSTERPDRVAASLQEGRAGIIVDNTPFTLLLPATMNDLLQAADDYYERWMVATMIRAFRLMAAVISTVLPAVYIAMISYNPALIPANLAISIAQGSGGTPFPAYLEAFLMEGSFEIMREAGIRLPGNLGQTVGVVGAVVIGQSAVAAGVVSPTMVIVVAITGIANFAMPTFDSALSFRLLRFLLLVCASILGYYGVIIGLLLILSHLCTLKSFGTPYMAPWIPLTLRDLKDTVFKSPWMAQKRRPSFMKVQDEDRMNLNKNETSSNQQ